MGLLLLIHRKRCQDMRNLLTSSSTSLLLFSFQNKSVGIWTQPLWLCWKTSSWMTIPILANQYIAPPSCVFWQTTLLISITLSLKQPCELFRGFKLPKLFDLRTCLAWLVLLNLGFFYYNISIVQPPVEMVSPSDINPSVLVLASCVDILFIKQALWQGESLAISLYSPLLGLFFPKHQAYTQNLFELSANNSELHQPYGWERHQTAAKFFQ